MRIKINISPYEKIIAHIPIVILLQRQCVSLDIKKHISSPLEFTTYWALRTLRTKKCNISVCKRVATHAALVLAVLGDKQCEFKVSCNSSISLAETGSPFSFTSGAREGLKSKLEKIAAIFIFNANVPMTTTSTFSSCKTHHARSHAICTDTSQGAGSMCRELGLATAT